MGSKRIRKKQLKQDKFVSKTFEFTDWARENQKTVTFMAVAVIIVVALSWAFSNYRQQKEQRAYTSLYRSMQAYRSANYLLAASDLENLLTEHSGSSIEDQALYYLANAHYKMGNYDRAEEILNRFRNEFGDDSIVSLDALLTLAYVQEEKGDIDKAVDSYILTATKARFPHQEKKGRMNAARLFIDAGKYHEALEQYESMLGGTLPEKISNAEMEEVRMLRAEVSARLRSGDIQ
jgi:predicted negative regulator of RcsB-dependent stress response